MRHFFDFSRAASGARDEFLVRLLLKVFEAGKPAFEVVIFLTEKIIDDHSYYRYHNQ